MLSLLRLLTISIFIISLTGCCGSPNQGCTGYNNMQGDNCIPCRDEPECPIDPCVNPCHRPVDCGPTVEQLRVVTKGSKCMGYNPRADLLNRGGQIIEIGQNAIIIVPNDLLFNVGCPSFREEANCLLNALHNYLTKYCGAPLYISGHTDNVAPSYYNCWLSDAQAQMVQGYLWARGFHFRRLSATGCGDFYPIANQLTVKGNAANRRIEIRIRRCC